MHFLQILSSRERQSQAKMSIPRKSMSRLARRAWSLAIPRRLPCRDLATHSSHPVTDVRIVEVGPRDGLQNEKGVISVATKIEMVRRLAATGIQTIEAGSFVSPKWTPQVSTLNYPCGAWYTPWLYSLCISPNISRTHLLVRLVYTYNIAQCHFIIACTKH